jgi:hypothetical protein
MPLVSGVNGIRLGGLCKGVDGCGKRGGGGAPTALSKRPGALRLTGAAGKRPVSESGRYKTNARAGCGPADQGRAQAPPLQRRALHEINGEVRELFAGGGGYLVRCGFGFAA